MVGYGNLRCWDPEGLTSASTELRADLKKLEKARDEIDGKTIPDSWVGLSRIFAEARKSGLVRTMSDHLEGTRDFERAIFRAEAKVSAIKNDVADIDGDARAQDFEISFDGAVNDVAPQQTFDSIRAAEHYSEQRATLRDALVERIERVVEDACEVDRTLLGAVPDTSFSDGGPEVDDPDGMGEHDPLDGPVPLGDEAFDITNIEQGSIGDCWFLASAGAVGGVDPDWIRDHIEYNPDGSYTVTLYEDGEPVEVRVEGSTIDDGVTGSDDEPSWLSIYEKAAAAHMGGSYDDIDADQVSRGLEMVTGRDVDSDDDMSLEDIRDGIGEGRIHVVSTENATESGWNPFDEKVDDDRVVPNHAYIIDRVEDIDGDGDLEVHVVNPWGPDGGSLDGDHKSGDLWLSEDDFQGSFDHTSSIGARG